MKQAHHERRVRWHWQNLSKADHDKRLPISGRAWLYVFAWTFRIEWHLWNRSCRLGMEFDGDDGILLAACLPPFSFYFGLESPWLNRRMPHPGRRCEVAVHDWAIWLNPWSKQHEWCRSDPWWVRGVTFHIDDFILGKRDYLCAEDREPKRVVISLDGFEYHGMAKFERQVWWRPRWPAFSRKSTWIDMDRGHGLPHSGKGENSWDCGDDALCGWGIDGHDVDACIRHGVESVMERRRRYGMPNRVGPSSAAAN